jgi:hypothetical protein
MAGRRQCLEHALSVGVVLTSLPLYMPMAAYSLQAVV